MKEEFIKEIHIYVHSLCEFNKTMNKKIVIKANSRVVL